MPKRHRILIVDNSSEDRQAVIRALAQEAAELEGVPADVQEADTLASARQALREAEFTCIFLNHALPDGTAQELLMEIRAQGLATPVVVLTGERTEQIIEARMCAGAAEYLPKDQLSPDLVARSLRAALRFLQAQREKQAALQAALAELHARDRALAAASNGIVIADPHQPGCPVIYTNEAFLQMTGYTEAEVIGRSCRFLQGPDTSPDAVAELREAIRQERGCQVLILNYRKNGSPFWNEVTLSPVRDVHGTLIHFVGVQADTTARYEADGERTRLLSLATREAAEMTTLYEREHRIAEALQRSLLNTPPKRTGRLDVETIYRPAWDEAQVGGDFYDSCLLDRNRLALVVGDVSGKGLQAASRTAEVKYTLRAYLREFNAAAPALNRLNAFLCESQALEQGDQEYFVVLTLAVIDSTTGVGEIAVAGGDPPLILRADGGVQEVQASGLPLGVVAGAEYAAAHLHLASGDLLLISTDGITETRRGREFLGNDGLARLARQALSAGPLAETGAAILRGVQEFATAPLHDDVCLLLARHR